MSSVTNHLLAHSVVICVFSKKTTTNANATPFNEISWSRWLKNLERENCANSIEDNQTYVNIEVFYLLKPWMSSGFIVLLGIPASFYKQKKENNRNKPVKCLVLIDKVNQDCVQQGQKQQCKIHYMWLTPVIVHLFLSYLVQTQNEQDKCDGNWLPVKF